MAGSDTGVSDVFDRALSRSFISRKMSRISIFARWARYVVTAFTMYRSTIMIEAILAVIVNTVMSVVILDGSEREGIFVPLELPLSSELSVESILKA